MCYGLATPYFCLMITPNWVQIIYRSVNRNKCHLYMQVWQKNTLTGLNDRNIVDNFLQGGLKTDFWR